MALSSLGLKASLRKSILQEINTDTVVLPGHGTVAGYADLAEYVAMLTDIRGKMMVLIGQGASLEEVMAANVTANWDVAKGDPTRLVNRACYSLTR